MFVDNPDLLKIVVIIEGMICNSCGYRQHVDCDLGEIQHISKDFS